MSFRISGKNLDIGEALRERVNARIAEVLAKYFDGGFSVKPLPGLTVGIDAYYKIATNLIDEGREDLLWHGVPKAIRQHDTATIFDWLFDAMSYQGLSNAAVYTYMERHGRGRWQEIGHLLEAGRYIDWAFVRGPAQADGGKVHRSVRGSDHYPISFELRSQSGRTSQPRE